MVAEAERLEKALLKYPELAEDIGYGE